MLTLLLTSRVLKQGCWCNIVTVLVILKVNEDSNIPFCYYVLRLGLATTKVVDVKL